MVVQAHTQWLSHKTDWRKTKMVELYGNGTSQPNLRFQWRLSSLGKDRNLLSLRNFLQQSISGWRNTLNTRLIQWTHSLTQCLATVILYKLKEMCDIQGKKIIDVSGNESHYIAESYIRRSFTVKVLAPGCYLDLQNLSVASCDSLL